MRISVPWLQEFVDIEDPKTLPEALTAVGIEVESTHCARDHITGVVIAEVVSVEAHPKADKLSVCQVKYEGDKLFEVVCGAPNVKVGIRVPYAKVGSRLGDLHISARKLRGIESQGMLCAQNELQMGSDSAGLWILPDDAPLGKDIVDYADAGLELELGITPNRPDLLSHLGVAREVAALQEQRPKNLGQALRLSESGPPAASLARVIFAETEACSKYCARVIQNVKVGPSPWWLRRRLESVGQRSINNIVDATNYVLMELGHPLHAFDLEKLKSDASSSNSLPTICVRHPKVGESLVTLDGVERELHQDDLLIADGKRAVALAGVMGGANSEVCDETTSILLESAWFEPTVVRRGARRQGLHTEASHRFERGADPHMIVRALDRCTQLIVQLAGGDVAQGILEAQLKTEEAKEIKLRLSRVEKLLGRSFNAEDVVKLLEPLEVRCTRRLDDELHFGAPSFRPDLEREVDLIEEIARRFGYNNFEETLPSASQNFRVEDTTLPFSWTVRRAMVAAGGFECVNYGFGSTKAYGEGALTLLNPLGEEHKALRTSLVPGLLKTTAHNVRQGHASGRFFEIGNTFHPQAAGDDERDRLLPTEVQRIAGILYGYRYDERWHEGRAMVDASDLIGWVEHLVAQAGRGQRIERLDIEHSERLNPHAAARLFIDGVELGCFGALLPSYGKNFDLGVPAFVFEFDLSAWSRLAPRRAHFSALPRFPASRRDVAFLVPESMKALDVSEALREGGEAALNGVVEDIQVFDVYVGKGVESGMRSVAFALTLRHGERTLTEEEIAKAFDGAIKRVEERYKLQTRS